MTHSDIYFTLHVALCWLVSLGIAYLAGVMVESKRNRK